MPHKLEISPGGTVMEEASTLFCLGSEVHLFIKYSYLFIHTPYLSIHLYNYLIHPSINLSLYRQKDGEFVFVSWTPTRDPESGKATGRRYSLRTNIHIELYTSTHTRIYASTYTLTYIHSMHNFNITFYFF